MIWFPSGGLPQHRKAVLRNDINSSITCPKGKYHCESNITVEDNITAAGNITHNVARRYSNRFLRLFLFFLKNRRK